MEVSLSSQGIRNTSVFCLGRWLEIQVRMRSELSVTASGSFPARCEDFNPWAVLISLTRNILDRVSPIPSSRSCPLYTSYAWHRFILLFCSYWFSDRSFDRISLSPSYWRDCCHRRPLFSLFPITLLTSPRKNVKVFACQRKNRLHQLLWLPASWMTMWQVRSIKREKNLSIPLFSTEYPSRRVRLHPCQSCGRQFNPESLVSGFKTRAYSCQRSNAIEQIEKRSVS